MERRVDLSGTAFCDVDGSGHAEDFITYLDHAADHFAALKNYGHSVLRLRPGDSILDVGCGCGDDLRKLASLVAPNGRAVGVDISKSMVDEARRRNVGDEPPLEFEVGDASNLRWDSNVFDACRADRVFQHLPDPRRALNEMIRVLKPGGRISVADRDWGMIALDSCDPVTTGLILKRACSGIRNGWIGRQLWKLFQETRVINVEVRAKCINLRSFEVADSLLDLRLVLEHAVAENLLSRLTATQWIHDLLDRDAEGHFFATLTLYIVWGTKMHAISM
jgi:ubiquinone/menaquinone biosynthesis C-methylase UbiE